MKGPRTLCFDGSGPRLLWCKGRCHFVANPRIGGRFGNGLLLKAFSKIRSGYIKKGCRRNRRSVPLEFPPALQNH